MHLTKYDELAIYAIHGSSFKSTWDPETIDGLGVKMHITESDELHIHSSSFQ